MPGVFSLSPKELKKWLDEESAILIDVREKNEYDQDKIEGSYLVALSSFESQKVPQTDKKIVFHCRSGKRSLDAATRFFQETKKECYNLEGGIIAWKNEGF
jgi:rhodanese-related sulfurtransferase